MIYFINMFMIFGLGNPGKKYEKTRHNIGARAADEIAANFQFPITEPTPSREGGAKGKKRFISLPSNFQTISKGKIANEEIILAEPQTFMNCSGITAKKLIKNLKFKIKNLIVIHDDIDLSLGQIRIVKNRGSAGHKGVESIIKELGTKNFIRFRIGIKPASGRPKSPEKFVLQNFSRKEEKAVKEAIKNTAEAIELFLKKGLEEVMNKYNSK